MDDWLLDLIMWKEATDPFEEYPDEDEEETYED